MRPEDRRCAVCGKIAHYNKLYYFIRPRAQRKWACPRECFTILETQYALEHHYPRG